MTEPELKRYDLFATGPDYDTFFSDIVETPEGKYVRFADVEAYTQSAIAAAMMGAYKEGWSDGAANYHHDRNETPDDGWLISDTYKSIPTDASASRTHFEQERADHG